MMACSSFSSVQFICSVLSDSLHHMNHSVPGLPVHHQLLESTQTHVHCVGDAISSSHPVIPFSHFQSFPASGSFQMSQLFPSGGQSIGVSASTSVLPVNTQDWSPFRMDWLDLLSVQGIFKSLLQHHSLKASILHSALFILQLSHPYMTTGKTIALTRRTFVGKVMSLLFNMLSRLAVGHCQLPVASHCAPHLEGSCLLCKTSWTTTALYVSSSWAYCIVEVASCLCCLMTHFELGLKNHLNLLFV